jgi:hypothetical protein
LSQRSRQECAGGKPVSGGNTMGWMTTGALRTGRAGGVAVPALTTGTLSVGRFLVKAGICGGGTASGAASAGTGANGGLIETLGASRPGSVRCNMIRLALTSLKGAADGSPPPPCCGDSGRVGAGISGLAASSSSPLGRWLNSSGLERMAGAIC